MFNLIFLARTINALHCHQPHNQTEPGNFDILISLALLIIPQDIIRSIWNYKSNFWEKQVAHEDSF